MTSPANPGEDKAWELLESRNSMDVCRLAKVSYDPFFRTYTIRSFGMDFHVSQLNKTISSESPGSEVLQGKIGYFFRLSVLWYLVSAKEVIETGRLVRLQNIKNGEIFSKGSHILPLERVAQKYGKNREGFLRKGRTLGGELARQADVSLRLLPLPRIPVVLALWMEDDEFPARADLLLDSTCQLQVATDVLWSIAMMSVLVMMEGEGSP
jgi:hypothetical protein